MTETNKLLNVHRFLSSNPPNAANTSRQDFIKKLVRQQRFSIDEDTYLANLAKREGWQDKYSNLILRGDAYRGETIAERLTMITNTHIEGSDDLKKGFGLSLDMEGPRFLTTEVFLWFLHLWLLFRRIKQDIEWTGEIENRISNSYYKKLQLRAYEYEGTHKASKALCKQLYGLQVSLMYQLDHALNFTTDADMLTISAMFRINPIDRVWLEEEMNLDDWKRIVEYLRFHMSFLDHLDEETFYGGLWHWYSPMDKSVFPEAVRIPLRTRENTTKLELTEEIPRSQSSRSEDVGTRR